MHLRIKCIPLRKGGQGGVMKRRFWTGSEFIPISVRYFPPLAKGGLGGVASAEPWPGTRVPSCWASRNCRLGRA